MCVQTKLRLGTFFCFVLSILLLYLPRYQVMVCHIGSQPAEPVWPAAQPRHARRSLNKGCCTGLPLAPDHVAGADTSVPGPDNSASLLALRVHATCHQEAPSTAAGMAQSIKSRPSVQDFLT